MNENNRSYILALAQKMEILFDKQNALSKEIAQLRSELKKLQLNENIDAAMVATTVVEPPHPVVPESQEVSVTKEPPVVLVPQLEKKEEIPIVPVPNFSSHTNTAPPKKNSKSALEKFIGENLVNKIGIIILLIGIAIGVKYSIDHDLISPVARIVLGYVSSIALLVIGFRLKEKYNAFSAVLVSGAMAATYFVTYAAFSYYGLFPRMLTFLLMVLFTVFTVFAAIQYNRPIIAHIGLIGAYAVPFLLNDNSGSIGAFFTYVAVINVGILIVAFLRKWQSLFYASFGMTWIIVLVGVFLSGKKVEWTTSLSFATFFFLLFYSMFLANHIVRKHPLNFGSVAVLLINSFVYYGIGYALLADRPITANYVGLFTVLTGLLHFIAAMVIYKKQLADKKILYLVLGMVLVFITIAIPVQLEGNWVTMMWLAESVLLYWIGCKKGIVYFERMAYPVMLLGFFSLMQDWENGYLSYYSPAAVHPLLNIYFLTGILGIVAFYSINQLRTNTLQAPDVKQSADRLLMSFAIPAMLLVLLYMVPFLEINNWFVQQIRSLKTDDVISQSFSLRYKLERQSIVWLMIYSCLFIVAFNFWNGKKLQNKALAAFLALATIVTTFAFLVGGLIVLGDLRDGYLESTVGSGFLLLRYLAIASLAMMLWSTYLYWKPSFEGKPIEIAYHAVLSFVLLVLLSNELIQWLTLAYSKSQYKLGLSILWGCYALVLIGYGISKQKQTFRILGIVLFGVTLVKVFLYDIASMSQIAKTVLFVILGVLLLVVSFLYNKYNGKISEKE